MYFDNRFRPNLKYSAETMIWTFPDIRISSKICSDILQKSILMAERPYRWVRVKSFANLTLQRIVDKPFMQEFLFWDTCTNLNDEAAEIKLREPIRTGFDQKIAKIKAFLGRLVQANTWASVDTRMRLQFVQM